MENNAYASPSENLAHLQRLYRITESDRRAYCQDTKVTLLRQRKIIHKLETKREEILSKFHDDGAVEGARVAVEDEPQVATLLSVYKQKKIELHLGRQTVRSQKSEIQSLQKELEKLLVTKGKFELKRDRLKCTTKKSEVLEDKLENASVHYNQVVYKSTTLRNTIEHLLKQRVSYRQILKNLNKTLSDHKSHIEGLINKAILNYNLREEKYQKLQSLKGKHTLDGIVSKSQLQEAQRMHSLQKQLIEFIGTKSHGRGNGARSSSHLASLSRDVVRGESRNAELLEEVTNAELFTYTSSLNNKMEELQNEIKKLKQEYEELEKLKAQKEDENKVVVKKLEVQLDLLNRDCSRSESELDKQRNTLKKLKIGIEGMSQLVSRNVTPSNDNDSSKPNVTRAVKNIENEVNELLLARQFLEDQQAKELEKLSSPTISNQSSGKRIEFRSFRKIHHSVDISLTPPNLNFEQESDGFESEIEPIFLREVVCCPSFVVADVTNDPPSKPRVQFMDVDDDDDNE